MGEASVGHNPSEAQHRCTKEKQKQQKRRTVKNSNQGIISGTESGAGGVGCGESVQRKRRINI